MSVSASTSKSLVFGPNLGFQQPSMALGQCNDWQGSRRLAFRHNNSAATSCALRLRDLSAASTIKIAASSDTFRSAWGDQKSTRSATARSALSSLVSASKLEAIEAWPTDSGVGEENDFPARIAASSLRRLFASRLDCRVTVRPMIDTVAVTSTPTKARTAATCPVLPVRCNGPSSTAITDTAAAITMTSQPRAHHVSLDAPPDSTVNPPFPGRVHSA